jgi:hypothetical protein
MSSRARPINATRKPGFGEGVARAARAGYALYGPSGLPREEAKARAALIFLNPQNILNATEKVKNGLRSNGITNTRKINRLANVLISVKNRYPLSNSNKNLVKRAALTAMSSYISQKIGLKNNQNFQSSAKIYDLLEKLIQLRVEIEKTKNTTTLYNLGQEMGMVLGELVQKWVTMIGVGRLNNRKIALGKGALRGFLNSAVGVPLSLSVMGVVEGVHGVHTGFHTLHKVFGPK